MQKRACRVRGSHGEVITSIAAGEATGVLRHRLWRQPVLSKVGAMSLISLVPVAHQAKMLPVSVALCRFGSLPQSMTLRLRWRAVNLCSVSFLITPHRRCSIAADTPAAENAVSFKRESATTMEEFEERVSDYPIAERLAALVVAKYSAAKSISKASRTGRAAKVSINTPCRPLPVGDFLKKISSVTRDDMFRRQKDVLQWVSESTLLTLMDEEGRTISLASLRVSSVVSAETAAEPSRDDEYTNYNPLVHVGVTVPVAWLLHTIDCVVVKPEAKATATPVEGTHAADPVLSASERDAVVREALMQAVQNWDSAMQRRRANAVATELTAADANGEASTRAAPAKTKVPRFIALTDVYCRMLRAVATPDLTTGESGLPEAAAASSNLSENAIQALRDLRMSTLISVVEACSVVVQLGAKDADTAFNPGDFPSISSRPLWLVRSTSRSPATFIALRRPNETSQPRFSLLQPRVTVATRENNFGCWGSAEIVPTRADVYEILKYVPVNWGNVGLLNIPPAVKKRHIRTSSSQMWFRRQPFYFELRDVNGTVEIRRSIVLHPEAHGMTKEEAWEVLEMKLATGEANNLAPMDADGVPFQANDSTLDRFVTKFLYRVCPTYFTTLSLIMQRYIKKNLTEQMLRSYVQRFPQDFEVLVTRYNDTPLVRRRAGADSSRWRDDFLADLEKYPEDVQGIFILCNYLCSTWDRPEYVYVRLSTTEQQIIGGYAGAQKLLSRHPAIFRMGRHFVCRANPSDPLAMRAGEPAVDDVKTPPRIREENPYLSPLELAHVFHYVMPDREPCTPSYLVDCASPAMRAVMPPRIITVVQLFPKMFACTETSPGVYSIRKLKRQVRKSVQPDAAEGGTCAGTESDSGAPQQAIVATKTSEVASPKAGVAAEEDETIQMLEDEIADEEHLTREDVIEAVYMLIPDSGVEVPQLLLWASMAVQRAASEHYGGVLRVIESHPARFRVVVDEHTKIVFRK